MGSPTEEQLQQRKRATPQPNLAELLVDEFSSGASSASRAPRFENIVSSAGL